MKTVGGRLLLLSKCQFIAAWLVTLITFILNQGYAWNHLDYCTLVLQEMEFEEAAAKVKELKQRPNDKELLELYGFYKQATVGDNNSNKPLIDLKGRAKWDAWEAQKGFFYIV